MLRKKFDEAKHKRELKKIGKKLVELIKLNDEDSRIAALKIIEEHQNDPEVINYQKRGQNTPLIQACALGKNKIAKRLLASKCVDVNAKGVKNTHALEAALLDGYYKIALLLANDMRVHINEAGKEGVPSIYIVLGTGRFRHRGNYNYPIEILQAILSRPDIDMKCRYVHEERDRMLNEYKYECISFLYALVDALHWYKQKAQFAHYKPDEMKFYNHNFEVGMQLLKDVLASGKVDIDAFSEEKTHTSHTKKTALMLAVELCLTDVVQMLLSAGANIHLRNQSGQKAVDIAKARCGDGSSYSEWSKQIVEMLKQAKVKESVAASPATMFGTQNQNPDVPSVPAEYLAPPKPSAPPEDILSPKLG